LSEGGARVPEARRTQVEADLEKLRARVARVEVATDVARADVFVDDVAMGTTPLTSALVVSAGRRKLSVAKSGYATATRWLDLTGGDTSHVNVELGESTAHGAPPAGSVAPNAPRSPRGSLSTVSASGAQIDSANSDSAPDVARGHGVLWGGWAIAGSLAVAAGVTGALAVASSRELVDERGQRGASRAELDRRAGEVRDLALATDVLAGAVVVAAGVTLFATLSRGAPSGSEGASLRIVPSLGRVTLTGKF
jgi:hypothetical protein